MLRLTPLCYDGSLWINPRLITSFESHEGGTVIHFDQDNDVKVEETPKVLAELLSEWED